MSNPPDTPTPAASAGPDFEAAATFARTLLALAKQDDGATNLARAYLAQKDQLRDAEAAMHVYRKEADALRSLPREGEAPVAWRCRKRTVGGGWGAWFYTTDRATVDGLTDDEVEPLYARGSVAAEGGEDGPVVSALADALRRIDEALGVDPLRCATPEDEVAAIARLAKDAARYRALRPFLKVGDTEDGERWGLWCLAPRDHDNEQVNAIYARHAKDGEERRIDAGEPEWGPDADALVDEMVAARSAEQGVTDAR